MKILINTASTYKGGGIQVAKSYIEEFKKFPENQYFVVLSENLWETIELNSFSSNFQFYKAPFRPATNFFSYKSHNYFLKEIEEKFSPDIVFSTGGPSYWRPKSTHIVGFTLGHYIYPESPYFNIISIKKNTKWKLMKILAKYLFKRDADILIAQTDDVCERVKIFLNRKKVFTISNTINTSYVNPLKYSNKLLPKEKEEFRLLTLSAWYPHKNISIIPQVAEILQKQSYNNIKFIVTLPDQDYIKIKKNHKNIINVGVIKIEEGAALYSECDALFLPTLLECFSASYAEAMIMEKTILTSDLGFAHTVCGDAAVYFDPMNPKDIASKIIEVYDNKELQRDLMNKGKKKLRDFGTAEERAIRILEICKTAIANEK